MSCNIVLCLHRTLTKEEHILWAIVHNRHAKWIFQNTLELKSKLITDRQLGKMWLCSQSSSERKDSVWCSQNSTQRLTDSISMHRRWTNGPPNINNTLLCYETEERRFGKQTQEKKSSQNESRNQWLKTWEQGRSWVDPKASLLESSITS